MRKYGYVKAKNRIPWRKLIRLFGMSQIVVGVVSLTYILFPLFSWQLYVSAFGQTRIDSPIPDNLLYESLSISDLVSNGVNSLTRDYTDARNWYDERGAGALKIPPYTLSIPKLKIKNAVVKTNEYDLSQYLVHYLAKNAPWEKGNSVIFGHSTLPQLFKPNDYKTIFATLHTIKKGDEIVISREGADYSFKVYSITITKPEDTKIFTPTPDSTITLVTCTPPGTIWKRLIVKARLEELGSSEKTKRTGS